LPQHPVRRRRHRRRDQIAGRAGRAGRAGIVSLAVSTVLAGCGGGDDEAERYDADLRERFVEDCTSAGEDEPVCGCFYDALEANVPIEDFRTFDEQIQDGESVPDEIVDLAVACGADPSSTPSTATTP
jgi:hypothetical protein